MNSGITMMRDALRARGLVIQRARIIEAMQRIDPISISLRRTATIYRRQYSVPGPNSLWSVNIQLPCRAGKFSGRIVQTKKDIQIY